MRTRLVDEHVDARALLKLFAEIGFRDSLRGKRLLVVLLAAYLLDDSRDFGVDVLLGHGDVEPRGLVEKKLCANRLVERLGLELREVLPYFGHRHAVAHVESNEPVEFKVHRFRRYFLSVYNCCFHSR